MQNNNNSFTAFGAHGIEARNDHQFYTDRHGTWCNECGNSGNSYLSQNAVPLLNCYNVECKNHVNQVDLDVFKKFYGDALVYECQTLAGDTEKTLIQLRGGDLVLAPFHKDGYAYYEIIEPISHKLYNQYRKVGVRAARAWKLSADPMHQSMFKVGVLTGNCLSDIGLGKKR